MSTAPVTIRARSPRREDARAVLIVWGRELLRFWRARARVASTLVQPLLLLLVLGIGLGPLVGGAQDFTRFLFPGVLAMTVATAAIMSAASIVWDREFGFLREMLVAPVGRMALLLGKAAGGTTIAVAQGCVVLLLAPLAGVPLSAPAVAGVLGVLILEAFALCGLGILIAGVIKRLESFTVVMQLLLTPLLFLSGALFPLDRLPSWMAAVVALNPLTYVVDPLRRLLLGSARYGLVLFGHTPSVALELAIVAGCGVLLVTLATALFARPQ